MIQLSDYICVCVRVRARERERTLASVCLCSMLHPTFPLMLVNQMRTSRLFFFFFFFLFDHGHQPEFELHSIL